MNGANGKRARRYKRANTGNLSIHGFAPFGLNLGIFTNVSSQMMLYLDVVRHYLSVKFDVKFSKPKARKYY